MQAEHEQQASAWQSQADQQEQEAAGLRDQILSALQDSSNAQGALQTLHQESRQQVLPCTWPMHIGLAALELLKHSKNNACFTFPAAISSIIAQSLVLSFLS